MPQPAVEVQGLRKRYSDIEAVAGVDLAIEPGEVFALLGPNGAGKTTAVEIMEGYRTRDAGEVRVLGEDPQRAGRGWRARIGIVPQSSAIFEELTPAEIIRHFAAFYPDPLPLDRVLGLVGLTASAGRRCSKLSGGQKRRVDLALGITGNPDLLFLDEPTTGFDPEARRQTWDVIRGLAGLGTTILLTTHYLDEAEALAGRVGIILRGRMAEVAPPDQIGGRERASARVTFLRQGALAAAPLPELAGTATVEPGHVTILTANPTAVVARLAAWSAECGVDELPGLTVSRPSLEEIYLAMVAQHAGAPE